MPYAEVIGDPVAHSKSPLIHRFWLEALGIAADYRACHVRADALGAYLAVRRGDAAWRGCNVTIPHKQAVCGLLDRLDPLAARIGAVNTVLRAADGTLTGTNTDVDGVGEAIAGAAAPAGADAPAGAGNGAMAGAISGPVVVLGSGGAARAAFACLAPHAGDVRILARSGDAARLAARDCGLAAQVLPFAAAEALDGAITLINATQLGMAGQAAMPDAVIAGLARMAAGARVFDMVYAPLETRLLAAAAARGMAVADGLTMLIGQAATAFARLFGQPAPRGHDAALRRLLTA